MFLGQIYEWKNIVLYDDDTSNGGTSYMEKTLDNFVYECELDETINIKFLNILLKQHGIQPLYFNDKDLNINSQYIEEVFYEQNHNRIEIIVKENVDFIIAGKNHHAHGFYYNIYLDTATLIDKESNDLLTFNKQEYEIKEV